MKFRFLLLCFLLLAAFFVGAQKLPSGINYQAVARDTKGNSLVNQEILLKISLLADNAQGKSVFEELHNIQTGDLGMFSMVIGHGKHLNGNLSDVPWSEYQIWMEIAIDEKGDGSYLPISASRLMAVPYAFHSGTADALTGKAETEVSRFENTSALVSTTGPSPYWKVNGNVLTFPPKMFIGTIDEKDLLFKTSNIERMRITSGGDINIDNNLSVGMDINVGRDANIGRDVNIDRDLNVDGIARFNNTAQSATKDDGSVIIEGGVGIEKNVNIGENTEIDGTLGVDGITHLKNTTESNNKDDGALIVEGGVGIENNINIGGNSDLTGNSTIGGTLVGNGIATFNNMTESTTKDDGAVVIEGGLGVEKNINAGGNVGVTGTTTAGSLNVNTTTVLGGATTVNGTTGLIGQVTINANVGGGQDSYGAYPLRVEGSDQGVAIKLSAATPLGANNFLTFFNNGGGAVGAVEGQNYEEKQAFPPYAYERAITLATEVGSAVKFGLSFIPVVTGGLIVNAGPCGACIAMAAIDLALATANLAAFEVFLSDPQYIGVTYSSGSADYAEWLERAYPEEKIYAGDIVAVNGGKITKYTEKAQQFMAISTNPAVLGNVPTDGNVSNMEKVAFKGQIPVKVRGIVLSGDYILPSGLHDGTGIAVSPNDLTAEQYGKIVGVAWSNSFLEKGISFINMAIGLNSNDVATLVAKQEKEIEKMEKLAKSLGERLIALEKGTNYVHTDDLAKTSVDNSNPAPQREMTRQEIIAAQMPAELSDEVMKEAMIYLETEYNRRGINIAQHSGLHKLLTDKEFQAEVIQKTQETYKATYQNLMSGVNH